MGAEGAIHTLGMRLVSTPTGMSASWIHFMAVTCFLSILRSTWATQAASWDLRLWGSGCEHRLGWKQVSRLPLSPPLGMSCRAEPLGLSDRSFHPEGHGSLGKLGLIPPARKGPYNFRNQASPNQRMIVKAHEKQKQKP